MVLRLLLFNLVCILLFNGLTDWYFYRHLIRKTGKKWLSAAHWILDGLFVAATLLLNLLTVFDEAVSTLALQSFMFLYLAVYLPKLIYLILSLPSLLSRNRTYKRIVYGIAGTLALIIFFSMLYGNLIGKNTLRIEEVTIESSRVPEGFDGYRLAVIADLHLGNMRRDRVIEKMLVRMPELSPDAILFAGDLVHLRSAEAWRFEEILSRFHAPDGIYAVMGNHDYGDYVRWPDEEAYRENISDLRRFYRQIGWRLLDNESLFLHRAGDSIAIVGVENWGEPPFQQYGDLDLALKDVRGDGFKVLMTHNPNHWLAEVKDKTDIDLAVSGHTHAMQLSLGIGRKRWSPSRWRYELWGGLYTHDDQYIYVNEGIGTVMMPFRLGATPELTVITLKTKP